MTLQEAFGELINNRTWYEKSGFSRQQATRDKRFFREGKIVPEERIRHYLRSAGNWKQTRLEEWTLKEIRSALKI